MSTVLTENAGELSVPIEIADPINARILAVSEDRIVGFRRPVRDLLDTFIAPGATEQRRLEGEVASGNAQQDTSLVNRVNEMLKLTQVKDLEKVMDFTYPKLFTIAPREALIEVMKNTYETDEYIIELDSVNVVTIFPIFKINDTSYAKVKHTMLMKMKYKEPYDTADKESKEFMVSLMQQKFGEGNARFDPIANSLNILMVPDMVGIKIKTSN